MRVGRVMGKVSLVKEHPTLKGKRYVLVVPMNLEELSGGAPSQADELVVIDELGAMPGDRIGLSEGMEATFPYFPAKMPVDCYNACILDEVSLDQAATQALRAAKE